MEICLYWNSPDHLHFLVSCSPVSGVSIPEGMEALLVGDVISQEVRIYDLTTRQIEGILQVRGYRYTGFELIDPDHLLFTVRPTRDSFFIISLKGMSQKRSWSHRLFKI